MTEVIKLKRKYTTPKPSTGGKGKAPDNTTQRKRTIWWYLAKGGRGYKTAKGPKQQ